MVRCQGGFTYLGMLLVIAMVGASLAGTGVVWRTAVQEEKESELLFIGGQIRRAIARYYLQSPGPVKQYPPSLEALLKDERFPSVQRYLRRLYADPITGRPDWGLVRAPEGGIAGVFSLSTAAPLKTANFRPEDAGFAGAASYADWRFVFMPGSQSTAATPGGPIEPVPTPDFPRSTPLNRVPPDPLTAPPPMP